MAVLAGKKAFITGSSRGLGKAIALQLAREGCDILLHYRRNEGEAQKTAQEIKSLGVHSFIYRADLCNMKEVHQMWTVLKSEHQSLDFLIANAASTSFKNILDLSEENIQLTFDLVIKSFIYGVQQAVPLMRGRNGSIITVSGMDTTHICPRHGLLGAAKAGLEILTKYLSAELSKDKIYSYCLNPGFLESDSTQYYLGKVFPEVLNKIQSIAAVPEATRLEEMAKIVLFLCRPDAKTMSGKVFYADGMANSIPNFF